MGSTNNPLRKPAQKVINRCSGHTQVTEVVVSRNCSTGHLLPPHQTPPATFPPTHHIVPQQQEAMSSSQVTQQPHGQHELYTPHGRHTSELHTDTVTSIHSATTGAPGDTSDHLHLSPTRQTLWSLYEESSTLHSWEICAATQQHLQKYR